MNLGKIYADDKLSYYDRAALVNKVVEHEFRVESDSDESESVSEVGSSKKRKRKEKPAPPDIGEALKLYKHIRAHMFDDDSYYDDCDKRVHVFNAAIMAFPELSAASWPERERLNPDGTFKPNK